MPGTHTHSKKSAFYQASEQVAVEELAERLHETGQQIDWITRDWILDPIGNSAAPMSMMTGAEGFSYYQMYRDYLETFEAFFAVELTCLSGTKNKNLANLIGCST